MIATKHILNFFIFLLILGCSKSEESSTNFANVKISGSDTEHALVNDIIASYKKKNDKVTFDLDGGGSSIGINDLIDGKVNIANSSRPITYEERLSLEEKGIRFQENVIAKDAISIISDPGVGVSSLSTSQLSDIFSGRIKNWKQLGGKDLKITLVGRDQNSGTRSYLEKRFARYEGFPVNHIELKTNTEIVKKVENTKGAMGYVGIGYIMNSHGKPIQSVWTMDIYVEGDEPYSPYELIAVTRNKYELIRPLYQYININNADALAFASFMKSEESASIIRSHGFYLNNE